MTVPMDPDGFFRDWSTDTSGNRVLVGLTPAETAEYLAYQEDNSNDLHTDRERLTRWLELHDKHELARIAVISAENEFRVQKPPLN
jgi:hypothetical protein